jgi:proteasome lid subunit RPN8/RPN11
MSRIVWEDAGVYSPTVRDLAEVAGERGLPGLAPTAATFAIRRSVQRDIQAHARSKPVEIGGILVGEAYVDPITGHFLVDVVGSLPAIGAHGTGTYFKFTSEAWDYISNERARRYPDLVTVGWYHSHPGLGVFYSATDRASQEAFFHHPWNIGLVIDPVSNEIGAFVGRNSARCDNCLVYYDSPARQMPAPPTLPPSRRQRWVMMACGAGVGSLVAATLAARNRRHGRS